LNGTESSEQIEGYAASYIQKYVKCNKDRCKKCKTGPGHGPYWYKVYRTEKGKVKTKYAGKVPPEQVEAQLKPQNEQNETEE